MYVPKVRAPRQYLQPVSTICFWVWLLFDVFSVVAQDRFIPDRVQIQGLKRTKERIVSRELAFQPGTPLYLSDTSEIFRKSCRNIFNTRLFNYVRYGIDSLRTDSVGILHGQVRMWVSERWYTFPNPIFELADRNFNEWWYDRNADLRRVNLGIRFIQRNVRGRNEDLLIGIQGGFTHRLDLQYIIPYLDRSQKTGMRFYASYSNNKDVAVKSTGNRLDYFRDEGSFGRQRSNLGTEVSYRPNIYDYHYLNLVYNYQRISDTVFKLNPQYFLGTRFQRFTELRYSFLADHRNIRYYATKGYFFQGTISRYGILPIENLNLWSMRLVYSRYFTLGRKWFAASKVDVEISEDKPQPYLGTRVLGFENRFVRGYERYVVEGPYNLFSRNSIRFRAIQSHFHLNWVPLPQFRFVPIDLYLNPFIDAGFVHNSRIPMENKRLANTLLLGYGLGLHLVTFYDVVFRVEYARNRHGDQGVYISFLTDI